jgi:hypothetical protein
MTVNTRRVRGRRAVHYESYHDLLADAERLAAGDVEMLGNWSLGQVIGHLANTMNASIDGFSATVPWPLRIIGRLLMRKTLLRGPIRPGFKLPATAEAKAVPSVETSDEEGLAALRHAVKRQESETHRVPHYILGNISLEEWTQAHLRHAEMHMSFAAPEAK